MRGGKPGFYPSLKKVVPHPVPFDLFDPFGLSAKASPEKKEKGLLAEINNGPRHPPASETSVGAATGPWGRRQAGRIAFGWLPPSLLP